MLIKFQLSTLRSIRPGDFVIRFLFGGAVTVITGLIALRYSPVIAGLFLAFPAIFPATATLIATHEKERKRAIGRDGTHRGRTAAGIDAAGTSLGTIGLAAFALTVWRLLPRHSPVVVLLIAGLVWLTVSVVLWLLFRRVRVGALSSPQKP